MRQAPIRLGPLALLLTLISICLAVLAILSFSTARADLRLAEKTAETVHTRYALDSEGLRKLAAGDPKDWETDENGLLSLTLRQGSASLEILLSPEGEVRSWTHRQDWEEDTSLGELWDGK